ncbi:MAG: hypothetical protein ACLPTF_04835 [Steroidobacteraceae bacterium]
MDKDGIVFDGLPMGMRGGAMSEIARGSWQWVSHSHGPQIVAVAADAECDVEADDVPMSVSIKGYERLR